MTQSTYPNIKIFIENNKKHLQMTQLNNNLKLRKINNFTRNKIAIKTLLTNDLFTAFQLWNRI